MKLYKYSNIFVYNKQQRNVQYSLESKKCHNSSLCFANCTILICVLEKKKNSGESNVKIILKKVWVQWQTKNNKYLTYI